MTEKGFFASICDFFKSLFGSAPAAEASKSSAPAAANNDGLTGVERYIRNQTNQSEQLTGVEKYIRNQANAKPLTGVEKYIRNQANAKPLTGVEKYIRSQA